LLVKSRRFGETVGRFQFEFHDPFILMCIAARQFPIIWSFSFRTGIVDSARLNSPGFVATIGCAMHSPMAAAPCRARLLRAAHHSAFSSRWSVSIGDGARRMMRITRPRECGSRFRTFAGEFA
ncbi:hypothetical protein, partial [Pseudomonas sp. MWU12-2323]|uniref:hypothetical protein n=1 Tax=Pseudomonas sp. MWU12-2323 TaxID=2651296 RepID=UPI001C49B47C